MIEKKFCVYRHIRLDTGKVFYIGISSNSGRPYSKHKRNRHWTNITNKVEYEVQIIHRCGTWEEVCELEELLISYYGRRDLNEGSLVNMTNGGEGNLGQIFTIESRQRMSRAQTGRKHTEESRKKISIAGIGRKLSEESMDKGVNYRSLPVIMLPPNVIFKSAEEAFIVTDINAKCIRRVCKGKRKTAGGYQWKHLSELI